MPAYKDDKTGKWYVSCWYKDWQGVSKKKVKRGFETKRDAQEWEREFLLQGSANPEMTVKSFYELYRADTSPKLKENTWLTKENIIIRHILPTFGDMRLCDITAKTVIDWQNAIRKEGYSDTYMRTIHNQLSTMLG